MIYRFVVTGQFERPAVELDHLQGHPDLLCSTALLNTLQAFALAAVLSLMFGAVFAAGRLSDHRWVSRPATAIVEFFRAVPLLVLIFIIYFGLSRGLGITVSAFTALVAGLMLYNGSVLAEIFRAGVNVAAHGVSSEAAYALGMRKTQVMTNVLLPQALRAMLPTIISQLVVVLKDTALGFLILYPELLYQARTLGSQGQLGSPILQVALVDRGHLHHDVPAAGAAGELPGAPDAADRGGRTRRRPWTTPRSRWSRSGPPPRDRAQPVIRDA